MTAKILCQCLLAAGPAKNLFVFVPVENTTKTVFYGHLLSPKPYPQKEDCQCAFYIESSISIGIERINSKTAHIMSTREAEKW